MNNLVKHSFNAHEFPKDYEINTKPSMTIPDQSLTMRQILDRYARGLSLGAPKVELWEGEDGDDFEFQHLDLADQEAIIKARVAELEELKQKTRTTASPDKTRTRKTPAGEASTIEDIEPITETKNKPPKEVEK